MPNARSFRRVALLWLLRAWAFLFCARAISLAACSYSGLEARPPSHQALTTAAAATWTWQTVTSGFFPPKLLADSGQEQIAHGRDRPLSAEATPWQTKPRHEAPRGGLEPRLPDGSPYRQG